MKRSIELKQLLDSEETFMLMSRTVLRRIKISIFISIIYNAVGLALGSLGMLTPVMAVIFQEAGCISVVLSSTLLLWANPRPHVQRSDTWLSALCRGGQVSVEREDYAHQPRGT